MHAKPCLQWALCLWRAFGGGPSGHQRGASAAGFWQDSPHACHRPPPPGHVFPRHCWRALARDLWSSTAADCQVACAGRRLAHDTWQMLKNCQRTKEVMWDFRGLVDLLWAMSSVGYVIKMGFLPKGRSQLYPANQWFQRQSVTPSDASLHTSYNI